ncbi:MAG: ATP-binding cassette domain-containing protein, partial [Merismopedia sp. SIO2A8]|nr:ATP-binding cassette domain-containing protein [Merismopedia sp. SIO2A8]
TPTKGRIVLNNRVLFDAEQGIDVPSAQRRVGFVFQNYALFPHMRVARNIGFGLQDLPREERQSRVEYYINLLQLQGLERHYPHQLSGGQQQRVALARVLATNPEILLLDEPLSALDNYLRDRVEKSLVDLFSTYAGTALIVTHNLEEAYRLCDRWLVLSRGKAIAYGRKEDVFERPGNYATAQLTECKNISSAEIVGDGYIRVPHWDGCILKVAEPLPDGLAYVGIRAHHVGFWPDVTDEAPEGDNVFPAWPVFSSETQHRVTLYLSLVVDTNGPTKCSPPLERGPHAPYHLQAELPKDVWFDLKQRIMSQPQPRPLWVSLDALRLILMAD